MTLKADAAKIKRWREERHWSQEHLADLAGIGLRTLQRIEKGQGGSRDTVAALAAAFEVDAVALAVDVEQDAAWAEERKAAQIAATMRLGFVIHLGCFLFALLTFAGIGWAAGDFGIMQVAIWWGITLAAHGLVVVLAPLSERHSREYGKTKG